MLFSARISPKMCRPFNTYISLQRLKILFPASIQERFQQVQSLGIQTVFLQVRAFADAYYTSTYYMSGLSMSADCSFDPLQIMLTEAHQLGLSVHAWVNPLRCQTDAQMEQMPEQYPISQWYADETKRGTWLVKSGDRWWLNPIRRFGS